MHADDYRAWGKRSDGGNPMFDDYDDEDQDDDDYDYDQDYEDDVIDDYD